MTDLQARAHRGVLEAALDDPVWEYRPTLASIAPRRPRGAHNPEPIPQHAPYTGTGA